uniref:WGS project CBMI000000000 data, contig CS3069_c002110 n=1 Tax=Fusarium clavum TaxID=2594811 RepID=A0A090N5M9_9HYPO|nr:unnamed protein product [Fusarium clavum]
MKERELTIKNAHKDTFHWILEDNDTTGFRNWLVSDKSLYWITGKPGINHGICKPRERNIPLRQMCPISQTMGRK